MGAMRRWLVRAAVLVGLVAVGLALRWTVFRPEPLSVTVAPVERGTVEETVTNTRAGTVEARRRAKLSPEVGGLVVEIPHREGERVEQGDVLLRLASDLQRSEALLARRELAAAEAKRDEACLVAERAVRERDRQRRLADEGIISEDLLDSAVTAAETGAASCAAARATVEQAAARLGYTATRERQTLLRAPFSGVVADVRIELGEWATPAPPAVPVPPVLDLIDPSSIYISAPMDEVDAEVLHPGLPARVTVDSRPGEELPGRVLRVAPYVEDVEEQNRTIEIEVELDDPAVAAKLLPGTSADVEVILETREDVLRVPTLALVEGERVLVVEHEGDAGDGDGGEVGVLAAREVETGLSNWNWTEIVSGVEAGRKVVTALDRAGVEEGARVVVEEE